MRLMDSPWFWAAKAILLFISGTLMAILAGYVGEFKLTIQYWIVAWFTLVDSFICILNAALRWYRR